ncbi:MAG: hypothetical protein OXH08_06490 [Gammaproteobacteria bacterium]|nr:hypothetical protein [Gammaproteobacteria bacterium]
MRASLAVVALTMLTNDVNGQVWSIAGDGKRIVFPTESEVDSARAFALIQTLDDQMALIPDMLQGALQDRAITISLMPRSSMRVEGRAFPSTGVIVLPVPDAFEWSAPTRARVIRHELAHIGLAELLDYNRIPRWFEEGFAEWAAGGLTCEGEARVRLDVMRRNAGHIALPSVGGPGQLESSRLAYDYWGTVIEYIEGSYDNVIGKRILIHAVKTHGIGRAFEIVLGRGVADIELEWHEYLRQMYGDIPVGYVC